MSLTLYYHPLSSYCWKALIALYEAQVDFTARVINFGDEADFAALKAVWPLGRFPVLADEARGMNVPEATIIIEYLARHEPGAARLLPSDPDLALRTRLRDRLFDNYVHDPLQRVVAERMRPDDQHDPLGAQQSRDLIRKGYGLVEPEGEWAMGDDFTLADCAAFPALFYADYAVSLNEWPALRAYLERLKARPSIQRVLAEKEPFFHWFPLKDG